MTHRMLTARQSVLPALACLDCLASMDYDRLLLGYTARQSRVVCLNGIPTYARCQQTLCITYAQYVVGANLLNC